MSDRSAELFGSAAPDVTAAVPSTSGAPSTLTLAQTKGMSDADLIQSVGGDPQVVMSSKLYKPGMLQKSLRNYAILSHPGIVGSFTHGASDVGENLLHLSAAIGAGLHAQSPADLSYVNTLANLHAALWRGTHGPSTLPQHVAEALPSFMLLGATGPEGVGWNLATAAATAPLMGSPADHPPTETPGEALETAGIESGLGAGTAAGGMLAGTAMRRGLVKSLAMKKGIGSVKGLSTPEARELLTEIAPGLAVRTDPRAVASDIGQSVAKLHAAAISASQGLPYPGLTELTEAAKSADPTEAMKALDVLQQMQKAGTDPSRIAAADQAGRAWLTERAINAKGQALAAASTPEALAAHPYGAERTGAHPVPTQPENAGVQGGPGASATPGQWPTVAGPPTVIPSSVSPAVQREMQSPAAKILLHDEKGVTQAAASYQNRPGGVYLLSQTAHDPASAYTLLQQAEQKAVEAKKPLFVTVDPSQIPTYRSMGYAKVGPNQVMKSAANIMRDQGTVPLPTLTKTLSTLGTALTSENSLSAPLALKRAVWNPLAALRSGEYHATFGNLRAQLATWQDALAHATSSGDAASAKIYGSMVGAIKDDMDAFARTQPTNTLAQSWKDVTDANSEFHQIYKTGAPGDLRSATYSDEALSSALGGKGQRAAQAAASLSPKGLAASRAAVWSDIVKQSSDAYGHITPENLDGALAQHQDRLAAVSSPEQQQEVVGLRKLIQYARMNNPEAPVGSLGTTLGHGASAGSVYYGLKYGNPVLLTAGGIGALTQTDAGRRILRATSRLDVVSPQMAAMYNAAAPYLRRGVALAGAKVGAMAGGH